MKNLSKWLLLGLSLSSLSFSQEPEPTVNFKNPVEYETYLRKAREEFLLAANQKRLECLGTFKTLELTDGKSKESRETKLSAEDKEICLSSLRTKHQLMLEKLYQGREKFIDYAFEVYKQRNSEQYKNELINIDEFYKNKKR